MNHGQGDKRQYLGLDIIRFAAATLVMIYHLSYWNWQALPPGAPTGRYYFSFKSMWWFSAQGWVGVPIFFVLSGFVIAFSANGKSFAAFAQGRIARLYPAAWICSSLTLILLLASHSPDAWARYLRSMLLWPVGPWVSGVYWTLGVEVVFYCLVAAVLATSSSRNLRLVGWGLLLASGGYLGLRVLNMTVLRGMFVQLRYLESPLGSLSLISSGGYFALGIFLWATMVERTERRMLWPTAAAVLVSLVAVTAAARSRASGSGDPTVFTLLPPVLWFSAALGIAASIRHADEMQRRLGRWSGLIRTLGLLTYPLYLLHDVLGTIIMKASLSLPPVVALTLAILICLMCSYAVVKAERYPRRLLNKAWNVRMRPIATTPADLP